MEQVVLEEGWERVPSWECLHLFRQAQLSLSIKHRRHHNGLVRSQLSTVCVKTIVEKVDLEEPTPLTDQVDLLGRTRRESATIESNVTSQSDVFSKVTITDREAKSKIQGPERQESRILELRHEGPCRKMRGTSLRIGAQILASFTTRLNTLHGLSSMYER